ncbi:MAG: bifunctional riboflavin kinase/FAD synthetase [Verrucomicrobiota bacterium]|nr:bifunctional riboflavin kinase/FAD synthetase [Verrucomicrobiota bacterium]
MMAESVAMRMKTIQHFEALPTGEQPVFCAIGMFDGLHLGHQSVLKHLIDQARSTKGLSVVLTFQTHPAELLTPDRSPKLIYPTDYKQALLESIGVDIAWMIPFDKRLSQMSAEDFVEKIRHYTHNLSGISVGSNFSFGSRRKGNVDLLKDCGKHHGFQVEGKVPLHYGEDLVSSTRIRHLIQSGDIEMTSKLLGRPYSLMGQVISGDGLGRKLGFPTANLDCQRLALPPLGVYAITCNIEGQERGGVLNIGKRPTLNHTDPKLQVEAHFWDFEMNLYDKRIGLEIKGRLRGERRFPDVDSLKSQIKKDIQNAQCMLEGIR